MLGQSTAAASAVVAGMVDESQGEIELFDSMFDDEVPESSANGGQLGTPGGKSGVTFDRDRNTLWTPHVDASLPVMPAKQVSGNNQIRGPSQIDHEGGKESSKREERQWSWQAGAGEQQRLSGRAKKVSYTCCVM